MTPEAKREYDRKRYLANRDKFLKASREWKIANRTRRLEADKRWRAANPDKVREYNREYTRKWRAAHPERVREISRKSRAANADKVQERNRKWRAANPERVRENNRKWAKANPEKRYALGHRRRSRKAGNGGSYTAEELQALYAQYNNQCIGPGPHGGLLTADHVIPVGEPNSTGNISNIQPLCQRCNSRKGHRTIDYRGSGCEVSIP